jgi:hypothetical protein
VPGTDRVLVGRTVPAIDTAGFALDLPQAASGGCRCSGREP